MDPTRFDRLTRTLSLAASRRGALAALLSAALSGTAGLSAAKKKQHKGKAKGKGKAKPAGRVGTEAVNCLSPGPGSNLSGCNFNNEDFAGSDLSSSRLVGTRFRGANLCSADLSSSQLKNADFRGFPASGPNAGNPTNLFRADLSSSGCSGVLFNARTLFCRTRTCNGAFRDDDCPIGVAPDTVCCGDADCADLSDQCHVGRCEVTEDAGACVQDQLDPGTPCDDENPCTEHDVCSPSGQCQGTPIACPTGQTCNEDSGDCEDDGVCAIPGGRPDGALCLISFECCSGCCRLDLASPTPEPPRCASGSGTCIVPCDAASAVCEDDTVACAIPGGRPDGALCLNSFDCCSGCCRPDIASPTPERPHCARGPGICLAP